METLKINEFALSIRNSCFSPEQWKQTNKKNTLWHWDVSLKVLLLHWPLESLKLKLQLIHSKYIRLYGIYFCPKFISLFIACFLIFPPSFALVVRIRFAFGLKKSKCLWLNQEEVKVKVLGAQSCLTLCNPWIVAHQVPLAIEFSRQGRIHQVPLAIEFSRQGY